MSGDKSLFDTLTEIRTKNRADFEVKDYFGSNTLLAAELKEMISFFQDILVISPEFYSYNVEGEPPPNDAIGALFDVSLAKKIRAGFLMASPKDCYEKCVVW